MTEGKFIVAFIMPDSVLSPESFEPIFDIRPADTKRHKR